MSWPPAGTGSCGLTASWAAERTAFPRASFRCAVLVSVQWCSSLARRWQTQDHSQDPGVDMPGSKHSRQRTAGPVTYFAPAERAPQDVLKRSIRRASQNPLIDTMLEAIGAWVAVLNRQRQVLAVNNAFLEALGIDDPAGILGLRPGEILHCVHATEEPAGCGTTPYCASCGAVIAMMTAQASAQPQQRECALRFEKSGAIRERAFSIRCAPLNIEGEELLLICLVDVTDEKDRAALERTFLHDISNALGALSVETGILVNHGGTGDAESLVQVQRAVRTVARELKVQRMLAEGSAGACPLSLEQVRPQDVLADMQAIFGTHAVRGNQRLTIRTGADNEPFETDVGLLTRVLSNMLTNAFEAGSADDEVRLEVETSPDCIDFSVWNAAPIPQAVQLRVFQRYFSTKEGVSRGLGTFAMKLVGESLLGGSVSFTSSEKAGTTFRLRLPRRNPAGAGAPPVPRG